MRRLTTLLGGLLLACSAFAVGKAHSQNVKTYIPDRAYQYLPTLYEEVLRFHENPASVGYFAGLGELESCITLVHPRCWSPTSELKTSREQGVGIAQLTRAWRPDGSLRFDTLSDLARKYRTHLKGLSWTTVKQRPDLQLRAMVLLWEENFRQLHMVKDIEQRYAMADSAYNGGLSSVLNDRRLCSLKKGCDPQVWFDNVELTSNKSRKILYGNRSAFDINRHHVREIMNVRRHKYDRYFQEKYGFEPRF